MGIGVPAMSALPYTFFWVQLVESGAPVAVRRYAWIGTGGPGGPVLHGLIQNAWYSGWEFAPAKDGEKIGGPAGIAADAAK